MPSLRLSRAVLAMICAALCLSPLVAADRSPAAMAEAAGKFLAALVPEQQRQGAFPFNSAERERWGYEPTESFPRQGLPLSALSEAPRRLALELVRSGLSDAGYATATAVMNRERLVKTIEDAIPVDPARAAARRPVRDPLKYYVSIFGTPSPSGTWAWRIEGNHLSLNMTIVNGEVASTPTFFGAYPARVPDRYTGPRLLSREEDLARTLLLALDSGQRKKAMIAPTANTDISTRAQTRAQPLPPTGVSADEMTASQRDLLMQLIGVYSSAMATDISIDRLDALRQAGVDKIVFSWAGEPSAGTAHYYRIQGPTFLIEYDNAQDGANHIHSVWRDFEGDFGRKLLSRPDPGRN